MANIILLLFCFGAGMALRTLRRLPDNASAALNGFVINIGLPALAISSLHRMPFEPGLIYTALMPWLLFLAGAALLWPLCTLLKMPRRTTGCVILLGGLGNTAFVGIPMIEAFYGPEWMSLGVVADMLGSQIVLAVLGIALARAFGAGTRPAVGDILRRIVIFPPFLATVAALALQPVTFPQWLDDLLLRLSLTVAPIALLSIGFQLRLSELGGKVLPLSIALTYKLLVGPMIVLGVFVGLIGAEGTVIQITIFEAAMAPMISAAIVAMDNDLDPPLASLLAAIGVPLSFLILPLWYSVLSGL